MTKNPIFPIGHFYSPIVDPDELKEREPGFWEPKESMPGLDMNPESHRDVLENVIQKWHSHFNYPTDEKDASATGFHLSNDQFTWLDARALFCFMCEWKPKRIIEVGSGYSTAIMLDVKRRFLDDGTEITCVEPYPRPVLRQSLKYGGARLVQKKAQLLDPAFFDVLEAGDILFIDSSHVVKTGSDCSFLYLEVLPRLKPGVLVHIHDIFIPFEYPKKWAVEENRSWNEQYILRALLAHTYAYRVKFGSAYASYKFKELAQKVVESNPAYGVGGGSFWIERTDILSLPRST